MLTEECDEIISKMSATMKSPLMKQNCKLEYCIMAPVSVRNDHENYVLLLNLENVSPLLKNGNLSSVTVKRFRNFLRDEQVYEIFDERNTPSSVEKILYEDQYTEVTVTMKFAGDVSPFELHYESN